MKLAKDYYSTHLVIYEPPQRTGYTSIQILSFLNGKPWDELALAYIHAVRPSSIRVTKGGITLDSRTWRVTVIVDEENIIKEITQEVEVGLPEKVVHGQALDHALTYGGINSEQCQWHNDDIKGYICAFGKYYKQTADGRTAEFPTK